MKAGSQALTPAASLVNVWNSHPVESSLLLDQLREGSHFCPCEPSSVLVSEAWFLLPGVTGPAKTRKTQCLPGGALSSGATNLSMSVVSGSSVEALNPDWVYIREDDQSK